MFRGKISKQPHADYLRKMRLYSGKVPKAHKQWLGRAIKLALATVGKEFLSGNGKDGRGRRSRAEVRTPDRFLKRRRGRQGHCYKCPQIREQLWDWFVDIRRSISTTVSPKFLLQRARCFAQVLLEEMRRTGKYQPLPKLDYDWLRRFRSAHGIVYRLPNRRFKCSKETLMRRLRAMWLTNIKVRQLALRCLGNDLSTSIYGIDEKPIHFNESGSKNVRTLEFEGAPAVSLKENHAATRERLSVMTMVTSNEGVATCPRRPPLEMLFKARSKRRTGNIAANPHTNCTVQWAEKGSYKKLQFIEFLRRHLEEWTPERAAQRDYRICYSDVAQSHCGGDVQDFCWTRGYVMLYHYGGTTAVAQVNDTDCHGDFEMVYVNFEQEACNERQAIDPGNISRTVQEVYDDVVATWRSLNHSRAVLGHKRTGLSVALDGPEDHHLTREAGDFWKLLNMPGLRKQAIAEVDAGIESGDLVLFADWSKLIVDPGTPGTYAEGEEFEGELAPGEKPWITDGDHDVEAKDEKDLLVAEGKLLEPEEGDDAEILQEAQILDKRLKHLRRLRALAQEAKLPRAGYECMREITQLERGLSAKDKPHNEILRRHLAKTLDVEARALEAKRAASRESNANKHKAKVMMEKFRLAQAAKAAEKKELQKKIDALPLNYSAKECGEGGKHGLKARINCLERLRLRAPPLPFATEMLWANRRNAYAKRIQEIHGKHAGATFLNRVNLCLKELGIHYRGETEFNKIDKVAGDEKAFEKYVKEMLKSLLKPCVSITMG
jgi:hypothetical protein